MRQNWIATVCMMFASVCLLQAEPPKSGPQVGEKVPGPFRPLHLTVPDAGQRVCLYCKYGANPVALVVARDLNAPVLNLLKQIDAATAAHAAADMGSFAVFLTKSDDLSKAVKAAAAQERIAKTVLTMDEPSGPAAYHFAPDAEVTVILYSHHVVKGNYSFRAGELNDPAIGALIADIAKIIPTE
jgi:hypothetical protein